MLEEGGRRGTGWSQRRVSEVGFGASRLYPDVCVSVYREVQGKGAMGSEVRGRKGQLC